MKPTLFIAVLIISSLFSTEVSAQTDKCAPSVSIVSLYYSAEAHTKFGAGFEIGMQGMESPLGMMAGFRFQKMSDNYFKGDSASFNLKSSLYLKGMMRLNQPTGRGSVLLVGAPELSVQTGFDFKAGTRFMLPLNGKKALGIEPLYSFRYHTVSLNLIAAF
jgi:hypothetical protein